MRKIGHIKLDIQKRREPENNIGRRRRNLKKHWNKLQNNIQSMYSDENNYQQLGFDYTIKIPLELAQKLDWSIGSQIYIQPLDEDLKQAIIGKKLSRKEIKPGLEKLQKVVEHRIKSKKGLSK
jgi:hypothetical protein